jgi:type I restriction enzyme S subunit
MSFPRYPKYKDSGVEWLGEVPEHWGLLRGRRLFAQKREPARSDDEQLSATQKYGVVPQKQFMELEDQKVALALSGTDNFKHVEKDDFVISLRSFQGGIERSVYSGCVSPAYTVLRATQPVCAGFWGYLLKSGGYIESLQTMTDGIRDGKSISYQQFGQIGLPVPTLPEQSAIAACLDRETAKIDVLIAEQQRLIELLQEKRQAVISHAVTEGLNSDVPMKDSGIEWLGEVPEHWDVGKLGHYLLESPCYGVLVPDFDPNGIPMLRINDLTESRVDRDELTTISRLLSDQYTRSIVCEGDLVISVVGQIGVTRVIGPELAGVNLSRNVARIQFTNRMCARFARWLFASNQFQHYTDLTCVGTAQLLLNMSSITAFVTVCPPFEEQAAITNFIDSRTAQCEMLEAEATRAIALLQERRSALISAAVTGQIDFRGLAGSEAA